MSSHNELGKKGEKIAREYLEKKGYFVLEVNWRYHHKEIDIIARDQNTLIIAEVKTRSGDYFQQPEEAVSLQKQKLLIDAAEAYILENNIDLETRLDILSVVIKNDDVKIRHIENAYYPTIN
jgi:putative endonuclease